MRNIESRIMDETRRSAVPWWAAFGAPLVGVPLLVGLLALGTPDTPEETALPEGDAAYTTEQVESAPAEPVDWVAEVSELPEAVAPEAASRC